MAAGTSGRQQVEVCIGKAGLPLGSLVYMKHGMRESCAFAYDESWLANPQRFSVSADLPLVAGYQPHKAASSQDSVFHGALADTAPDAWGRRVIAREHARRRKDNPRLPALTELDYLLAVDDFSRVGALRLRDPDGNRLRTVAAGARSTLVDEDGRLAIGKFPSVNDARSVPRGEVLAMKLAALAGIDAAPSHVVTLGDTPVAVIRRFDRDDAEGRIPYQSAASLLQALRNEDRSYTEIADAIRSFGHAPTEDLRQLWRRMVFNLLITNVDDHLQNLGFLHVEHGLWRLAPAFDVNPFPDKDRESKTWLSEEDGPVTDVPMLLARAPYFGLERDQALAVLGEVHVAVSNWRRVALGAEVGLRASELDDFAPAFEHEQMEVSVSLLGR